MALDDPIVWILIVAVVVFLFGSSKIPQFARSLGQARKEFDMAWKGVTPDVNSPTTGSMSPAVGTAAPTNAVKVVGDVPAAQSQNSLSSSSSSSDPLVIAAQNEGIDTRGKTREQIASELSWKLSKK